MAAPRGCQNFSRWVLQGCNCADCDVWNLTIEGKGGTVRLWSWLTDPTPAACQTVISREVSPRDTAMLVVLSLCGMIKETPILFASEAERT